jgi:hypothetical protein
MTDEERQKLCAGLRHAAAYNNPICDAAAEEIERLAALAQSDAEPTATRALLREARPYVASAKGDDTETHNFVDGLLRDIDAALAQSDAEPDDPLPREHQDPSKWPTRETVERAHAAQSDAEPVICPNCGLSVWQNAARPDALAQSNAGPVAWRWKWPDSGLWFATGNKLYADHVKDHGVAIEPLFAAARAADRSGPADYIPIGGAGNGA